MRLSRIVSIGLLIVATTACGGGDEPVADPGSTRTPSVDAESTPTPEPTPTEEPPPSDCPNQDDATAQADRSGRSLEGDVSGDGEDDVVTIVKDKSASEACRAFLVVGSSGEARSTPIDQEGMSVHVGFPALVFLVEIDGEPGLDIVVNLVAGASTQFAGVFTAADGTPERLRFAQPAEFGDLFPTGGSVGHLEASDCVGPGAIVITTAVPRGDGYKVTRTAYVVVDGLLTPQEEGVTTARIPFEGLDRFPEFQASPFGSCPSA